MKYKVQAGERTQLGMFKLGLCIADSNISITGTGSLDRILWWAPGPDKNVGRSFTATQHSCLASSCCLSVVRCEVKLFTLSHSPAGSVFGDLCVNEMNKMWSFYK